MCACLKRPEFFTSEQRNTTKSNILAVFVLLEWRTSPWWNIQFPAERNGVRAASALKKNLNLNLKTSQYGAAHFQRILTNSSFPNCASECYFLNVR